MTDSDQHPETQGLADERIRRGLEDLLASLEQQAPSERMRARFESGLAQLAGEPSPNAARFSLRQPLLLAAALLLTLAGLGYLALRMQPVELAPRALIADLDSARAVDRLRAVHGLIQGDPALDTELRTKLLQALERESHPGVELAMIEALARAGPIDEPVDRLPDPTTLSESGQWVFLTLQEMPSATRLELSGAVTSRDVLKILAAP